MDTLEMITWLIEKAKTAEEERDQKLKWWHEEREKAKSLEAENVELRKRLDALEGRAD